MTSTFKTPGAAPKGPGCPKLYPRYTTTSDTYVHGLYHDVLEEDVVQLFVQETESYDSQRKRWSIPEPLTKRESLIDALYSILSSVVRRFVKTSDPVVERHLISTQGRPGCEQKDENGHPLCPALVVPATGPSFDLPTSARSLPSAELANIEVGYPCMATYFTVKLDSNAGSADELVHEVETYARQILRDQPNRLYVRSLVITESHARLVHFDRAGAEITPPFNIHRHPTTLIRLVAGLCSADERVLGFDVSIRWTIVDRKKTKGTVTTTGLNGDVKTYPILEQMRTPRNDIRGRATTCWRVQDPDTLEELVVKDSWRPDDLRGEYEFLELVKDTPGVVHMVSYEAGRGETKDFRCPSTSGSFQNRITSRVTMKAYGRSIEHFQSVVQLLSAIRDAIAGHQRLVADDIRILHRDVSAQNVLLGKDGAPEGERGVLIDFDLAFRATDSEPTIKADHTIGLPVFQSLSVLSSIFMTKKSPSHDYLDDLQSFFYIFVYVTLLFKPDGSCVPDTEEGPSILLTWNEDDANRVFTNKQGIIGGGPLRFRVGQLIKASWGPIYEDLFKKFCAWTLSRRSDKERLAYQNKGPEHLLPKRDEHYSAVLSMFDEAIEAVKASNTQTPSATGSSSNPAPTLTPPPQVRRSARIQNLAMRKTVPSSTQPPGTDQPRRSARIQKRRLEEDKDFEAPHPQAKRVKKAPRAARHPR